MSMVMDTLCPRAFVIIFTEERIPSISFATSVDRFSNSRAAGSEAVDTKVGRGRDVLIGIGVGKGVSFGLGDRLADGVCVSDDEDDGVCASDDEDDGLCVSIEVGRVRYIL